MSIGFYSGWTRSYSKRVMSIEWAMSGNEELTNIPHTNPYVNRPTTRTLTSQRRHNEIPRSDCTIPFVYMFIYILRCRWELACCGSYDIHLKNSPQKYLYIQSLALFWAAVMVGSLPKIITFGNHGFRGTELILNFVSL